jgi:hypothetical protein
MAPTDDLVCAVDDVSVTVLSVPFHLDEQLTGFVPPVPPDEVIAPMLPVGDPWERMAVLYGEVADAVDVDEVPVVPQVLSAVRAVLSTVPVVAVTVGCTWRGTGTPQFAALVREIAESTR